MLDDLEYLKKIGYEEKGDLTVEELNKLKEQTSVQYEELQSNKVYDMSEQLVEYNPQNYLFYKTDDISKERIWGIVYKIAPDFNWRYNNFRNNMNIENDYIFPMTLMRTECEQLKYLVRISNIAPEHIINIDNLKTVKEIIEYLERIL